MKKLVTLLAIAFCLNTNAQTWVTIPDANFVTYLQSIVPAAMQHDSLNTSSTLVTTTTHTINVRGKNISDISAAQYFTSLTYLDCSQNNITSLPALPNTLKTLWCSNNSLIALPTLSNSLNYLYCDTNALTSLPALPHALYFFSCGNNQLTALPAFPSLVQGVYCCANYITGLPALPTNLYYLNCTENSLTSIPSLLPNSLQTLYLGDNDLTSLPTLPTALINFSCDYNNLTSLPALPNSLQFFICYENQITNMPALPNSLTYFDCSFNQIACFPPFPASITTFYIDQNPFTCLPNHIDVMNAYDSSTPLCAAGNTNGCAVVAGINQLTDISKQINIYPNPAQNNFTIETTNADIQTLKVTDVNGNLVLSQTINGSTNINTGILAQGVYNLSLTSSQSVANKRLVIVK